MRLEVRLTVNNAHSIADAKLLLPWRATGRLSAAEVEVVESAFALTPELEDDLARARLERQAIVFDNELSGAPSSRALDSLLMQIEKEARPQRNVSRLWSWVAPVTWSPRALAWSAGAAAMICLVQAGVLGVLLTGRNGGGGFGLASAPPSELNVVAVRFAPDTQIGTVTSFLDRYRSSIVGGPRQGLYRIKVPDGEGHESARRMSEERGVVEFAASVE
jgi:hypothetical protein